MKPAATVVKVALLLTDGRVLLLARSASDTHRPSGPDLPGGGREPGEDILATAVRELREEIGVEVSLADLHIVYVHQGGSKHNGERLIRILCAAEVITLPNITLSNEHESYEWVSTQDAVKAFNGHPWGEGLQQIATTLLPV